MFVHGRVCSSPAERDRQRCTRSLSLITRRLIVVLHVHHVIYLIKSRPASVVRTHTSRWSFCNVRIPVRSLEMRRVRHFEPLHTSFFFFFFLGSCCNKDLMWTLGLGVCSFTLNFYYSTGNRRFGHHLPSSASACLGLKQLLQSQTQTPEVEGGASAGPPPQTLSDWSALLRNVQLTGLLLSCHFAAVIHIHPTSPLHT